MPSIRATRQKLRWAVNSQRRVSVAPDGTPRGRVLLSYQNTAVLSDRRGQATSVRHPSHGETLTMVRVWRELGYAVDVVNFHNRFFRPRRHYDVVIDTRWNLERWARRFPATTLRVFHADSSHNLQKTHAEHGRLLDLQRRRGISLQPRQAEPFYRGPDVADAITVIGNDVTAATFALHRQAAPVPPRRHSDDLPVGSRLEDHDAVRARFLWLGSRGCRAEGYSTGSSTCSPEPGSPHLTVCGPVANERDVPSPPTTTSSTSSPTSTSAAGST